MRYSSGLTTLLITLLMVVSVVAVLGWIRPVRVVDAPDPYRVKFDSLQSVVREYRMTADSAMQEAGYWRWMAGVLAAKRGDVPARIEEARRTMRSAGLDSIQNVLMREP